MTDSLPSTFTGPLKRIFAGHVLLALATVAILARTGDPAAAWSGWDQGVGIVAALLVFVALYELAQRTSGDYAARLAGALWSGELGVRIAVVLLPEGSLPIGEARVLRLFLAGATGFCLAWSMTRTLKDGRLRALWAAVRWTFVLQLALLTTLELLALTTSRSVQDIANQLPSGALLPLGWTAFALPYVAQLFALHRSAL